MHPDESGRGQAESLRHPPTMYSTAIALYTRPRVRMLQFLQAPVEASRSH
jgi:hypothetical protein